MKQSASVGVLTALSFTLALGACAGLSSCAHAPPAPVSPSAPPTPIEVGDIQSMPLLGNYRVQRTLLPNGLKILVIEDHASPTFAYQTWFKVGSREEVPGRTGLAHLFEHMMFKETSSLKDGEFDRLMEEAGSEGTNAFTSNDYTAYVEELPSDQLEFVMKLEADRMVNLVVDDKNFKTEREVVQNERRQSEENNPAAIMNKEMDALSYTNHPYHWPVLGYEQDLNSMTAEDARQFYKLWYSPNKAIIVVYGDVRAPEVFALAKKYYGPLPSIPDTPQEITYDEDPTSPRRKSLRLNIQVEMLLMRYPIPAITHEDIPGLLLLSSLLSDGKSSRLYRALVETGLATSANSYAYEMRDPGSFVFEVSCQKGKKAAHAEAAILREIQNLAQNPIGPSELERAKSQLQFSYYLQFSAPARIANYVGSYETRFGDFQKGKAQLDAALQMTGEDLQRLAKKYLVPNKRTIIQGLIK